MCNNILVEKNKTKQKKKTNKQKQLLSLVKKVFRRLRVAAIEGVLLDKC